MMILIFSNLQTHQYILSAKDIFRWRVRNTTTDSSPTDPLLAGMGQVAKIRKDATGGFVLCSTGYGNINGTEEVESVIVVKINSNLELEWSQVRVVVELEV